MIKGQAKTRKSSKNTSKSKLTVGILINDLGANYHFPEWYGVNDVTRKHGINLLCFSGKIINDPNLVEQSRNMIYEFIDPENVDGLVFSGGLTIFEKDTAFFERFQSLPRVSIAAQIKDVPCIRVDNQKGFRDLLIHLIRDHGYRRLAFIMGPPDNMDAQRRYRVYRDVLAEHNIPFDPNLITAGQFHIGQSGREAVKIFIDERNVKFDVVVSANDVMTFGVYTELQERGIRIPDDIAVTGFDDQDWTNFQNPPLTTVRQSGYEQGCNAMKILLAMLQGEDVPAEVYLPTELVIRHSCGCFSETVRQSFFTDAQNFTGGQEEWQRLILLEMMKSLGPDYPEMKFQWITLLLNAFLSDIKKESSYHFLKTLNQLLLKSVQYHSDLVLWQTVITVMQRVRLSELQTKREILRAENLWHQARILIGEMGVQVKSFQGYIVTNQSSVLRDINRLLVNTYSVSNLAEALYQQLPSLQIKNCFLSLFEETAVLPEHSKLVLACNEKGRIPLKPQGFRFPTCQIFPKDMLPENIRYSLGVFPLTFREERLGFIVFDVGEARSHTYQTLAGTVGTVLKGALLVEKLLEKEALLEERNQVLSKINAELIRFINTIALNIQEPLQVVCDYLHRIEWDYKGKLDSDADEFIDYAVEGAARMQDLIIDLLAYSLVSTDQSPFKEVDCTFIINQVITNLQHIIEEYSVRLTWDPLPVIRAEAEQMIQLFQNLIENAIKFRGKVAPEVHIHAESEGNGWLFAVRDNGIGLDMQYAERIFRVFQRLHTKEEYSGNGIGLSVCKKIVERHGGRIWVQSELTKGATFYFTIGT